MSKTIEEGRVVWDRADYLALPYARRALSLSGSGGGAGCCLGEW